MKFIDDNCMNKFLFSRDIQDSIGGVQKFLNEFYKFLAPLKDRIQSSFPNYDIHVSQHPTDVKINLFTRTMTIKVIVSANFKQGGSSYYETEDVIVTQEGVVIIIHMAVPAGSHPKLLKTMKNLIFNKGE